MWKQLRNAMLRHNFRPVMYCCMGKKTINLPGNWWNKEGDSIYVFYLQ